MPHIAFISGSDLNRDAASPAGLAAAAFVVEHATWIVASSHEQVSRLARLFRRSERCSVSPGALPAGLPSAYWEPRRAEACCPRGRLRIQLQEGDALSGGGLPRSRRDRRRERARRPGRALRRRRPGGPRSTPSCETRPATSPTASRAGAGSRPRATSAVPSRRTGASTGQRLPTSTVCGGRGPDRGRPPARYD